MDHKEFLGDSLTEIAMEKAGIIKNEVPVVISQYQREVFSVFKETAKNLNSNIFLSDNNRKFKTDLRGNFQNKNISGVLKVLSLLKEFKFSDSIIKNGLLNVVNNTGLIGRFQVINKEPLVICDVGHNIEAFNEIYSHIKSIKHQKLRLVLGFVKGKDFKKY